MSIGVVIGTYGDKDYWGKLAAKAIASASIQSRIPDNLVWCHADTLAEARNKGAEAVGTDWLIFLDADDELDTEYVREMYIAISNADIYRPATLGIYDDGEDDMPVMLPIRDLSKSNYIVIGAMCPRAHFLAVGGFDEYPILEDWALWRKLVRNGATIKDVPGAVYRVGVREGSRNTDLDTHMKVYHQIRREIPL